MLTLVSESLGRTQALVEVARELSLNLSYFGNADTLVRLMGGRSRRFVLMTEDDLDPAILKVLADPSIGAEFGVVLLAEQDTLRDSGQAELLQRLEDVTNVEWAGVAADHDSLSAAIRKSRRRMLKLGKDELEQAIAERQLRLQYQPKVERTDSMEWQTTEAEALIRWLHPKNGLLGPLEFLPEAEAFELMGPISEFVLHEAAAQLARWREQGLSLNSCINLASSQLNNPELADVYERIVTAHGLECSSFTFEVAEQDVLNSEAPHLRVLKALREKGFRISLDDYGVAASSLGMFEQLPVDEIKIHASALRRARENEVAQQVLAAITGLAHNLGISVCAEGVEDEETFEFLKTIECDKMQGFLISEAVTPDIIRKVYSAVSGKVEEVA